MPVAIVTGSGGLVGSEAALCFMERGWDVVGLDNDSRARFFGPGASVACRVAHLKTLPRYQHRCVDIRSGQIDELVASWRPDAIVHAAAQPSHDWAATDPFEDFTVNATGTLCLLEAARRHCPEAPFVFMSTNKVYGDLSGLRLEETPTRFWAPFAGNAEGISEDWPVDRTLHSLFGVSKLSADLMVQEYGRYSGMPTVCFRAGCITGSAHAGAEQHGFLAYLAKCAREEAPYTVYGYGGKQVRDQIHARDLAEAFLAFIESPRAGAVYNIGGGPAANCSVLEAIDMVERALGKTLRWTYSDQARKGDHRWYVTDLTRFRSDYPNWRFTRGLDSIIKELCGAQDIAA